MRRICGIITIFSFILCGWAFTLSMAAGNAPAVYESLKCGMCHKPDKKAAGISLAEIASTYKDKEQLVRFFKGESKPLVESDRWGMMRGQLAKITELQDKEKEDLADYVLSFK